ncbi:MAG: UspA, partial [uncultured Nocardioides sp.]
GDCRGGLCSEARGRCRARHRDRRGEAARCEAGRGQLPPGRHGVRRPRGAPGRVGDGRRPQPSRQVGRRLRPAPDGAWLRARRGPHQHRRDQLRGAHRDRPAPPVAGGQAHPGQQRPAHPARRSLPGAGGQGGL